MSFPADEQSGVRARTLTGIADCAGKWPVTRRGDLAPGDVVVVSTRNSTYRLQALGGDLFLVSGGWFDRNPVSRLVTVNGCTFGGSVIWTDVVAAAGLFLEFGNRVSTTRIQDVRLVRQDRPQAAALPN